MAEACETILRDVPGLTRDWQVVFTLEGVREVLEIRVETERTDLERLEQQILQSASHAYPDFHLLMPLYVCRRWEGTVRALEGQKLTWVRPNRLRDYPMPPADQPLVSHLMQLL